MTEGDSDTPHKGECAHCGEPAETQCSGCHLVYYCNRDCQKGDWKNHRNICRPFTISSVPNYGKLLMASRDLKPNDVIITEYPLVIGPKQHSDPVCLGCYKKIDGKFRCFNCSWPLCSPECQTSPYHLDECELTRKCGIYVDMELWGDNSQSIYEVVTPLRCLILAHKDPKKWKSCAEKLNFRECPPSCAPDSSHEFVVDVLRNRFLLAQLTDLKASEASVYKVMKFLQVNTLPIKFYHEIQGLYPTASLTSHSCTPNTKFFWKEGYKLTMKATEAITKGTPLTGMFTDILWGTRARRDHLLQSRYFSCSCQRCTDPTEMKTNFSTLVCPSCPKQSPVLSTRPLDDTALWECTTCNFTISSQEVLGINLALGAAVEDALASPTIPKLEGLMKQWLQKVHTNHYHLHAVKHSLLQLYARPKDVMSSDDDPLHWEEIQKKETACKEFLRVCSYLDPSLAHTVPYVGLAFFEYHKTILHSAKRNFGLARISTQELKKRMLLAKALLKKTLEIFKDEPEDTEEGQLCNSCKNEIIAIGRWMLAVGLV